MLGYVRVSLDNTAILSFYGGVGLLGYMRDLSDNAAILFLVGGACISKNMWDFFLLTGRRVGPLFLGQRTPRNAQTTFCTAVLREKGGVPGRWFGPAGSWGPGAAAHRPHLLPGQDMQAITRERVGTMCGWGAGRGLVPVSGSTRPERRPPLCAAVPARGRRRRWRG